MITLDKSRIDKVFILEDDENRIAWFKAKFDYAHVLYITKQTGTAIELLNKIKFDLVFLDHDLEPSHYTDFAEGREPQMELTGVYVAKNLIYTLNEETPVIIHSMNPIGSDKMKSYLPTAWQIPFNVLIQEMRFSNEDEQ